MKRPKKSRSHLFKGNVLAVERLDKILLTVNYPQMSILIPLSYVARLEPSVLGDRLLSLLLILVVLLQHARPPDPNLALRRSVAGKVSRVRKIDEFDLDGRRDVADGVGRPVLRIHQAAHGRRFGQPIARDHGRDGHGDEALRVLGDGAAAVHADLQPAARGVLDFLEDYGVEDAASGDATAHQEALGGQGAPEEILHERTAGFDFCDDAFSD